jgi:hypothetical protein
MTKQTDRLTRVEERVINMDKKIDAMFTKFDRYFEKSENQTLICTKQQTKTETQTAVQWGFITVIVFGLIGIGLKSIGG